MQDKEEVLKYWEKAKFFFNQPEFSCPVMKNSVEYKAKPERTL